MDYVNVLDAYRDPVNWDLIRGNLWFMGHGPWRLMSMVSLYLLTVLKIGPEFMKNRQAYDLRNIVRVYNFLNIFFNIYLAGYGINLGGNGIGFFNCHCLDRNYERHAPFIDIFIISRVIDFLDTFFFVLRKKQSQITGLHVFHHAFVPLSIYFVASFSMTPFSGFLLILNSLVHVVMYSYYFLATFPQLAPHLWWKRYITRIQIGQFVLALVYFIMGFILLSRYCDDPPIVAVITNLFAASVFLLLFMSFYTNAYRQQQQNLKSL